MTSIQIAASGGIIGMFGYGLADFFAKGALNKFGHKKSLIYSQFLTLVFLFLYFLFFSHLKFPRFTFENVGSLILFGLANALTYVLIYKAFQIGKISVIAPLASTYGILSALISFLVFEETFSAVKIFFIILVILGIILTTLNLGELKTEIKNKKSAQGLSHVLLFILICGGIYPFWDKFLEGKPWSGTLLLGKIFVVLFIILALCFSKAVSPKKINKNDYIFIFLVGLLEALALIGTSWAFSQSANSTSLIVALMSIGPAITILMAHLFLKERLSFSQYCGICLILLGLFFIPFI